MKQQNAEAQRRSERRNLIEPKLLRSVQLTAAHVATGRTKHIVHGKVIDKPAILIIVQYPNGTGFYLFYCTDDGKEVTDTLHDSIEEAQEQAEWEFGVEPTEWLVH